MSQARIAHVYNPGNLTPTELIENFVVRLEEFEDIFEDIHTSKMESAEQHYIIQGLRGMGKTTLLLRLAFEIEKDPSLKHWLIPIVFAEEQNDILSLDDLWLSTAEILEEKGIVTGLYDQIGSQLMESNEEDTFKLLESTLQEKKKKLILFIDNIDTMLKSLDEKEERRLREILHQSTDIRIIGGSAKTLERFFEHDKPFFKYFKPIYLRGLDSKETNRLLKSMAEIHHIEDIESILDRQQGRIETLRRLTGGIPRTIILLFEIFIDESATVFEDLEFVLDRITELYKNRMADLSPIQRKIIHTIAINWDAMSTGDIAQKMRMESKNIAAQLKILEKQNMIEVRKADKKNNFYLISERFFNIWYLMRNGKRNGRERVKWLVSFLNEWCTEEELEERAKKHIELANNGKLNPKGAFYMTLALAQTSIDDIQHNLITNTRTMLENKDSNLKEKLEESDNELVEKALQKIAKNELNTALMLLKQGRQSGRIASLTALIYEQNFKDISKAITYLKTLGVTGEMYMLSFAHNYCLNNINQQNALHYLSEINIMQTSSLHMPLYMIVKSIIEAWTEQYNDAYQSIQKAFQIDVKFTISFTDEIINLFCLLLAKKQNNLLKKLLKDPHWNLKEQFKPIWYALMTSMQDEYPKEILKMGDEHKETVKEILEKVEEYREKYA